MTILELLDLVEQVDYAERSGHAEFSTTEEVSWMAQFRVLAAQRLAELGYIV